MSKNLTRLILLQNYNIGQHYKAAEKLLLKAVTGRK